MGKCCKSCGFSNADTSKFCEQCGAKLLVMDPGKLVPSDKDLTMLVDVCNKVCGLPSGNRYTEYVLYSTGASYEIHSYTSDGHSEEVHCGYRVDSDYAQEILSTITNEKMEELDQAAECPLCGVERILKFANSAGTIVRLSAGEGKINEAQSKIYSMLQAGVSMDNMIVTEYGKSWVKAIYASTGMNSQDCFNFELARSDGKCRICSKNEWKELPSDVSEQIDRIPLGMQLSYDLSDNVGMMGMRGMIGMRDERSTRCSVTYADGVSDEKVINKKMLEKLLPLIREYI